MELRQLRIFCIAAQTLNFSKTAEQLGYVQSNVTSQIHQLEEELNVKLFERFGRGIQLTSEGKIFRKNAERILQQCQKAKAEFSSNVVRGILNIGAAETICIYRLPKILMEYRKQYPHVKIRVQTESCNQLLHLIRKNSIDVALALTPEIKEPDMSVKTFYNEAMAVVASPLHPISKKRFVLPEDFSDECLILTDENCGYRPVILNMLYDYGIKPEAIMELSSVGAIKECTSCGLGVTVLPRISVMDDLKRGKLVELNWQGPSFNVHTQLVYHRQKWLSPVIESFLTLCDQI